jgi:uncharacterized DUF497 family protein
MSMKFEWREDKRQTTLKERSLDFADAFQFFDGRPVIHQPTPRHGEERWKSTAIFQRQVLHGRLDVARRRNADHFYEA